MKPDKLYRSCQLITYPEVEAAPSEPGQYWPLARRYHYSSATGPLCIPRRLGSTLLRPFARLACE